MIERAPKRRRISFPSELELNSSNGVAETTTGRPLAYSDFAKNASKWNLEQDYERRPRKQKKEFRSTRLPVKTAEGRLEQYHAPKIEGDEDDQFSDVPDSDTPNTELPDEEEDNASQEPISQQIMEAKEQLARIAALVNEDPEEHIGSLKTLSDITSSRIPTITKLGLATQLAVYKDVIPGYRIRPVAEDEMKAKLSKEVRKMRNFEQSIVRGYQRYIKDLGRVAALRRPDSSEETTSMSTVAISCTCNLLTSVPHFNFRSELLKIIVNKLSRRSRSSDFAPCAEAVKKLFENDDDGNGSLEAVAMLAKMIKVKNYHIDETVLNLFLHLRLLSELHSKASTTQVDKDEQGSLPAGKKLKQKREFRTKKTRKLLKEQKGIEKEMEEADAVVSYEQRDKIQSETLKLVFTVYFRILKARTPHLTGPVLEGLVKYAHLINQDFFGDLLESLKDLIRDAELPDNEDEADVSSPNDTDADTPRNITRESLLCVITAFALLQGQDASKAAEGLHLDLSFFITHLYRTLYPTSMNSDLELSARSLHLPDPDATGAEAASRTKVNVQTTIVLLLRSLHAVLLPTNTRSVPPLRLAAFSKQLLTSSLHMPEKSCTAMLGLMCNVAKTHQRKIAPLWRTEDRKGDGVFDPLSGEVEGGNPFASTVWEGELLKCHYAPDVREGVRNLEKMIGEA